MTINISSLIVGGTIILAFVFGFITGVVKVTDDMDELIDQYEEELGKAYDIIEGYGKNKKEIKGHGRKVE